MTSTMREIDQLKERLEQILSDEWSTEEEKEALKKAVLDATGHAEKLAPAPLELEPKSKILATEIAAQRVGPDLNCGDVMNREDYDEVVKLGVTLEVDPVHVAQLWSQLEASCKQASNTRIGIFALRVLVENAYLHKLLSQMNTLTNGGVYKLNCLHQKVKTPDKKKGK